MDSPLFFVYRANKPSCRYSLQIRSGSYGVRLYVATNELVATYAYQSMFPTNFQ